MRKLHFFPLEPVFRRTFREKLLKMAPALVFSEKNTYILEKIVIQSMYV